MFWKWIKVPKAVALLAFLLPWMTVSCQGQPLAKASGIGLTFGSVETFGQTTPADSASLNVWLLLAIVAIVGGLVLTIIRDKSAAKFVAATSAAAVVLVWVGTMSYSTDAMMEKVAEQAGSAGGGGAFAPDPSQLMGAISIDWHMGFYLTILALLISLGMAVVVFLGKEEQVTHKLGDLAESAQKSVASATAGMAGEKVTCPKCGHQSPAGTKFCPEDGTPLDAGTGGDAAS